MPIRNTNKKRIKKQNKARKKLGMPLIKGRPKEYQDYLEESKERKTNEERRF